MNIVLRNLSGDPVTEKNVKNQGFEIDINPFESLMIKLGRLLRYKLGFKKFVIFFILVLGVPLIFFIYTVVTVQQNPTFILDNIYIILIAVFILAFFLSVLSHKRISHCEHCNKDYATVPLKKEVTGKMDYKNGELYSIKELRLCEFCGKINTKEYTDEYKKESNEGY